MKCFFLLSKPSSRLSFRGEKLPHYVHYAPLSKLSNYWNSTWLQSLPLFFFVLSFSFFKKHIQALQSWMIFEKFLQFLTATCSLGHRLITPDQAWKRAESICLSPCRGHCRVVLLTPQHSILTELCYQSCASSSFDRTWDLFTAPWKQPFCLDFFCHSAAKSSVGPLFEKSFIVGDSLEILIEPLSMNCRDAACVCGTLSHRTAYGLYVLA